MFVLNKDHIIKRDADREINRRYNESMMTPGDFRRYCEDKRLADFRKYFYARHDYLTDQVVIPVGDMSITVCADDVRKDVVTIPQYIEITKLVADELAGEICSSNEIWEQLDKMISDYHGDIDEIWDE